jgi:hypothetical protein
LNQPKFADTRAQQLASFIFFFSSRAALVHYFFSKKYCWLFSGDGMAPRRKEFAWAA